MLVEAEIARQPPLHERERTADDGAGAPDLVLRMRRFELHPVDPRLALIGAQTPQAIDQPAARGIAGIALGHDDKVGIELVLHVDRGAVASDRLFDRHDLDPGALGPALAFDWLVVDAHAGDAGADAFAHHPSHRHDPAVTGVTIHDHREFDGLGDPAGDRHAFGHRRGADIGEAGIGADHARGADKAGLAPAELHDPRQRGARRVQHRQHPVLAVDQLAQPSTRRRTLLLRHARTSAPFSRPLLCGCCYGVSTVG